MFNVIFSTREIAIGIVYFLFFSLILATFSTNKKKEFTSGIKQILSIIFFSKITFIFLGVLLYVILISYGLSLFCIWENIFFKDIIIWLLFCGIPMSFKAFGFKDYNDFKNIVSENLQWSTVLIFLLSTTTFTLWLEIIFITMLLILFMINTVSKSNEQYTLVEKLTRLLVNVIFIIVLIYVGLRICANPSELFNIKSLIIFCLPIVLSITFIPLIYIIALVVIFESLFCRIDIATKNQCTFNQFCKIIIYSNLSIKKIHSFETNYLPQLFHKYTAARFEQVLDLYKKNEKCI